MHLALDSEPRLVPHDPRGDARDYILQRAVERDAEESDASWKMLATVLLVAGLGVLALVIWGLSVAIRALAP